MDEEESLNAAIYEEVKLHDYSEDWPSLYEAERQRLLSLLPDTFINLQHIGSTSIPGMIAKPIIDILAGVDSMPPSCAVPATPHRLSSTGHSPTASGLCVGPMVIVRIICMS